MVNEGALGARTPEEHRSRGIDVRTGSTVGAPDPVRRSLEVRDGDGTISSHDFDSLLIATSAEPIRSDLPGAEPLPVNILADRSNRRVIGVQIVGKAGSALRIDTAAMALWSGLTVDELAMIDLDYAPPLSPVWDPVQVAARAVIKELGY